MRIYLHIGTHKTGTTSIQTTLAANEDTLRKQGYLYPKSGRPNNKYIPYAQHQLAFSLVGLHDTPRSVWDAFHEEVRSEGFERIIVSAEDFSLAKGEEIRALRTLLTGYEVRVVLYLREPVDFMKSLYSERVRYHGYPSSFGTFVRANQWRINYTAVVERWRSAFNDIVVRPYRRNGLWDDFAETIGIEGITPAERRHVTRMTHESLVLNRWVNGVAQITTLGNWKTRITHGRTGQMLIRLYRAWGGEGPFPECDIEWLRQHADPFFAD